MLTWTKIVAIVFGVALTVAGIVLSGPHMRANGQSDALDSTQDTAIKIIEPWARATPGGVTVGAAYLKIHTSNPNGDRLIAAASPTAGRVEIHSHIVEDGVMKMRKVDGLQVSTNAPAELAPGGDHIMLFDLKQPLKQGDKLPLTLTFKDAGEIVVEAAIAAIGASGPGGTADRGSGAGHEHHHQSGTE